MPNALPGLAPEIGEFLHLSVANAAPAVLANFSFNTPGEGIYELYFLGAAVDATATLAAFDIQLEVREAKTAAYWGKLQASSGVLAFDGWVQFALDAQTFVPTVDSQTAVCALPRYALPKSTRVTVTAGSAQAVGFSDIRYSLRRIG